MQDNLWGFAMSSVGVTIALAIWQGGAGWTTAARAQAPDQGWTLARATLGELRHSPS